MISLGSVTNFGLGKLVANNFRNAKAYSNSEFAALIEATMKKLLLKPHRNFVIFQSLSNQPKYNRKCLMDDHVKTTNKIQKFLRNTFTKVISCCYGI